MIEIFIIRIITTTLVLDYESDYAYRSICVALLTFGHLRGRPRARGADGVLHLSSKSKQEVGTMLVARPYPRVEDC
eukprot:COSAG02_NODE_1823_length_10761_cov_32.341868_5_plen_76_part_00